MKSDILVFLKVCGTRTTDTLYENQYTFLVITQSLFLRMRNVSDNICTGNQNIHFMYNNFLRNSAVYDIRWENIVQRGRAQMTTWRMRIACWIPKAKNTHSEYE